MWCSYFTKCILQYFYDYVFLKTIDGVIMYKLASFDLIRCLRQVSNFLAFIVPSWIIHERKQQLNQLPFLVSCGNMFCTTDKILIFGAPLDPKRSLVTLPKSLSRTMHSLHSNPTRRPINKCNVIITWCCWCNRCVY